MLTKKDISLIVNHRAATFNPAVVTFYDDSGNSAQVKMADLIFGMRDIISVLHTAKIAVEYGANHRFGDGDVTFMFSNTLKAINNVLGEN